MRIRIATWNVERSGVHRRKRQPEQRRVLDSIGADILILTETHQDVGPSNLPYAAHADSEPGYHAPGEACAAIWSRFPLTRIESQHDNRFLTVCAEIKASADVGNILVYGTIITYAMDGVREGCKPWQRHFEAIRSQAAEWHSLRQSYPNHLMILAGDFNENLNSKRWYGKNEAKEQIRSALMENHLQCLTDGEEIPLVNGTGVVSRCTVDHICVSQTGLKAAEVSGWEGTIDGTALSDHNGVLADIDFVPVR